MRVCSACKQEKNLEDFHLKNKLTGKRQYMCKLCRADYIRSHYEANKAKYKAQTRVSNEAKKKFHQDLIIEYLREHPCVDCGNSDIEVLQFDHRDQDTKISEISRLRTGSTKRLLREMDKCDIRCANCHMKRTRRQLGWWTTDTLSV